MNFTYEMPQHMSLVLAKINVQNGAKQLLFVDGPDKQIEVLSLDTLTKSGSIQPVGEEQIRCAISITGDE